MINYASMHSESITRYHVIGMILHTHSNASFLSEPGAKSRSGGCHYLSTASADPNKPPLKQPPLNGPVHVECKTMRNVLASATEEELGALFVNYQIGAAMRMVLIEMGQAQPPTPAVTDSATGGGFFNDNIRQRRSISIDMRFYWVRDRVKQGKFLVYWIYGEHNLADYFTKHHPTSHHRAQRIIYLVPHSGHQQVRMLHVTY